MIQLRKAPAAALNLVLPIAIIAIGIGLFAALSRMKKTPGEDEFVRRNVAVVTKAPQVFNEPIQIDVSGLVVPYREITLSAKVAGIVKAKSPESRSGRYVSEKTELIEIDPEDYEIECERLTAEVAQANAMLTEMNNELEGAKELVKLATREVELQENDLARTKRIGRVLSEYEEDQSERGVIQAKNALSTQTSQVNILNSRKIRLEAAITLAEKQLAKAQLDLRRTKIIAPSDGVIVQDPIEVGTFVQKGATLLVFEDTSKAEITCNLQSNELYWILRGRGEESAASLTTISSNDYEIPPTSVDVIFEFAGETVTWKGRLDRLEGAGIDEKTRSIPCRIVVDTPISKDKTTFRTLVRGMYVTVRFKVSVPNTLLQVPATALRPGNKIWVARASAEDPSKHQLDSVDVTVVNYRTAKSTTLARTDLEKTVVIKADPTEVTLNSKIVVSPLPSSTAEGTEVDTEQKSL